MNFDVNEAARILVGAHRARTTIAPSGPGPGNRAEAFAVQDAALSALGPAGGWKVGAKGPAEEPICAPMPASLCRTSPCIWPTAEFRAPIVEAEIAFRIGRDLRPGDPAPSRSELPGWVDGVHAALEIVDSRLDGYPDVDRLWALADNQSNGGFVVSAAGRPWRGEDFASAAVRLVIDGAVRADGRRPNPAGDPARLVLWFLAQASGRGGVAAGTYVTTGSYTGMIAVGAGSRVEAEFPGIGTVELHLS